MRPTSIVHTLAGTIAIQPAPPAPTDATVPAGSEDFWRLIKGIFGVNVNGVSFHKDMGSMFADFTFVGLSQHLRVRIYPVDSSCIRDRFVVTIRGGLRDGVFTGAIYELGTYAQWFEELISEAIKNNRFAFTSILAEIAQECGIVTPSAATAARSELSALIEPPLPSPPEVDYAAIRSARDRALNALGWVDITTITDAHELSEFLCNIGLEVTHHSGCFTVKYKPTESMICGETSFVHTFTRDDWIDSLNAWVSFCSN